MAGFDAALVLLGEDHLSDEWTRQLQTLVDDPSVAPLVAGLGLRLLYDRAALSQEAVAVAFSRSLSSTSAPKAVGHWLDGFLGSAAEVILQDEVLLALVDDWLSEQGEADFVETLPMLRRAFSGFGATGASTSPDANRPRPDDAAYRP